MQSCHHGMYFFFFVSMGIYQYQVFTCSYVVMKTVEFFILGRNACKATLPGAETSKEKNNGEVGNDGNIGAKGFEYREQSGYDKTYKEAQHNADKAFAK